MPKCRVLKEGMVWTGGPDALVCRKVGEIIDVSPEAAQHLIDEGVGEIAGSIPAPSSTPPSRKPDAASFSEE